MTECRDFFLFDQCVALLAVVFTYSRCRASRFFCHSATVGYVFRKISVVFIAVNLYAAHATVNRIFCGFCASRFSNKYGSSFCVSCRRAVAIISCTANRTHIQIVTAIGTRRGNRAYIFVFVRTFGGYDLDRVLTDNRITITQDYISSPHRNSREYQYPAVVLIRKERRTLNRRTVARVIYGKFTANFHTI